MSDDRLPTEKTTPPGAPPPAPAGARPDTGIAALGLDLERLSLTEIVKLQNELTKMLTRRFERPLALAFTDTVGSTAYFSRFGDEAGRRLVQRHMDGLAAALLPHGGRIVDTAGDGAFLCFETAEAAARAIVAVERAIQLENASFPREHQLAIRAGLHHGPVLTDGQVVTGDAVNVCARVAALAGAGEVVITRAFFHELPGERRPDCHPRPPAELRGIARPVEVLTLEWRDPGLFPDRVLLVETGEVVTLPAGADIISFGRLREKDGQPANDVVLTHPDPVQLQHVSRWHFELRRLPDGFRLRPLSQRLTEVDGAAVPQGGEAAIRPGSVVRLVRALTLRFLAPDAPPDGEGDAAEMTRG